MKGGFMYDMIVALGAVAAALAALGWVVRTVLQLLQRVGRMTDDFLGRPESAPGAGDGHKGVLAQLREINTTQADHGARLRRVEAQVIPNGGGSIADGVNEIRRAIGGDQR